LCEAFFLALDNRKSLDASGREVGFREESRCPPVNECKRICPNGGPTFGNVYCGCCGNGNDERISYEGEDEMKLLYKAQIWWKYSEQLPYGDRQ